MGAVAGRTLILRSDASPRIGTGHLMRVLALGQGWSEAGGTVLVSPGDAPAALCDRLTTEGFRVVPEALATLLSNDRSAVAAVDLPETALAELAACDDDSRSRTLLVDDLAQLPTYPCGLVLNQNAHADRAAYPPERPPNYLLGLEYVLLRREFRTWSRSVKPVRRIATRLLVTFGGADPARMTLRAVQALDALPPAIRGSLEVRVLVGAANPDTAPIEAAIAGSSVAATLERSVVRMAERMAWADLVLVSGGTTVWELAAMGCPALVVETAPSEPFLVGGLRRVGLFDLLGPAESLDGAAIAVAIERRVTDVAWRRLMARRGQSLVDGRGVDRVVAALARLPSRAGDVGAGGRS